MKPLITIFTPTFNRGYILPTLYKSLQSQIDQNFEWLIVDDGSTDNTEEIINNFIEENQIEIRYVYQKNSGKHFTINVGARLANGELFFIVDSDDYLAPTAISILSERFLKIKDNPHIAGIAVGCYSISDPTKRIFSKDLPANNFLSTYNDLVFKEGIRGDFATAFKTEIQRQFPYPIFQNENFMRESIVYRRIGKKYKTLYIDDPIYFAEYLPDGLTADSWQRLKRNPLGASLFFKELSREKIPVREKLIALNAYWDIQLNHVNSKLFNKFMPVSFFLSMLVLINRKWKLFRL